jgi:uncharacterized protein
MATAARTRAPAPVRPATRTRDAPRPPGRRVWLDLANSPHALLFEPVARWLGEQGHRVLVTARDNAQTLDLALHRWPDLQVIGGPSPPQRVAKGLAIGRRVADLARWAREMRPDVALSHNSYAQVAAARAVGVPAVTAMDYEHQPANHLAFRLARCVLLPEALRDVPLRRFGATRSKVMLYGGLKEELYLGSFTPRRDVLAQLGVDRDAGPVVVARTPPTGATYHRDDNPLFIDALTWAQAQEGVQVVVLARRAAQRAALAELIPRAIVPQRAIDARSLIRAADVVLGAGGTMTREAALMGVPTWTVFAGREPAVDRWLMARGSMRRLEHASQLGEIEPRTSAPVALDELRDRADPLVRTFASAALQEVSGSAQR